VTSRAMPKRKVAASTRAAMPPQRCRVDKAGTPWAAVIGVDAR
jgi:hypothetical protein